MTGKAALRILTVNGSGNRIELELRFRTGVLYCCAEPGCFLPDYDPAWWEAVGGRIHERIDRDPPPFVVTIRGVVEEGALLAVHTQLGLPARVRHPRAARHAPLGGRLNADAANSTAPPRSARHFGAGAPSR